MSRRKNQLALALEERPRWGGKRKNAGRKPAGGRARMAHRARPAHNKANPVHITLRIVHGAPSLRQKAPFRVIKQAMAEGKLRANYRLVHFSVQRDHIHLLVEADDSRSLANGIRALEIRIARRIN